MIYKYPLALNGTDTLQLPKRAVILTAQNQRDKLQLWALVDSNEKETESRHFRMVLTGGGEHPPASGLRYISTVQFDGGSYVTHVFEEIR